MFSIIAYSITSIYVLMILSFAIGWLKTPTFKANKPIENQLISLVVCCKNEAYNLPNLLQSIKKQTSQNFEVIFANDHSIDETGQLLADFCAQFPQAKTFDTIGCGKKNALREAISRTEATIIACTDADCILLPNHLQLIANYFAENNPDLLLGGVKMNYNNTLFQKVQALEFASLIASAAGACGLSHPIMSNGANIAFTKDIWNKYKQQLHDEETSGDDIFLMMAIKQAGGKIDFLKASEAVVETNPQTTLKNFLNQRTRWTSKTKSYTDWETMTVAIIVFMIAVLFLTLFIGGFWQKTLFQTLAITFTTKWMVDTLFLVLFLPFFNQSRLILHTAALSAAYPFYIVFSAIAGIFGKFTWK